MILCSYEQIDELYIFPNPPLEVGIRDWKLSLQRYQPLGNVDEGNATAGKSCSNSAQSPFDNREGVFTRSGQLAQELMHLALFVLTSETRARSSEGEVSISDNYPVRA